MKNLILLTLAILGLYSIHPAQNIFHPDLYYSFDNPEGVEVVHNYVGCNLEGSPIGLTNPTDSLYAFDSDDGIVGQYLDLFDEDQQPEACGGIVDSIFSHDFTVEFWFQTSSSHSRGWPISCRPFNIRFGAREINFDLWKDGASGKEVYQIILNGTGRQSPHYWFDQQWHHLAVRFRESTGKMEVFLDGITTPDFSFTAPKGPNQKLVTGSIAFSGPAADSWRGKLDEIAFYTQVLPEQLIYQHYLNGIQGDHYQSCVDPSLKVPPGTISKTSSLNPLDFGPNYPHVKDSSIELIQTYPLARYSIEDTSLRLVPFVTDAWEHSWGNSFLKTTFNVAKKNTIRENARIYSELARNFNYYLFLGSIHELSGPQWVFDASSSKFRTFLDRELNAPSQTAYLWPLANDPDLEAIPRFMFVNWNNTKYNALDSIRGTLGGNINRRNLDLPGSTDDYLIKDAGGNQLTGDPFWAPDIVNDPSKMDSLKDDGRALFAGLEHLLDSLNINRIDCIGENGEVYRNRWELDSAVLIQDASVGLDIASFAGNLDGYKANRFDQFRQAFKSGLVDTLSQIQGSNPYYFWYNVSGNEGMSYLDYNGTSTINDTLNGFRRATPFFYPNAPSRWSVGANAKFGLEDVIAGMENQWVVGDSLINPAVSPGFNDKQAYTEPDVQIIRPGQFLGNLKSLGMIGADVFTYYTYDFDSKGNWRIWQLTTPAYAQATILRAKEFLYDGRIVQGDQNVFNELNKVSPYRFSTGNPQDLVYVRKQNGAARWLINGAINRLTNMQGSYPTKQKDVSINFEAATSLWTGDLTFEIRPQGSTYIMELDGQDTIFYQLDGWHDWKDPYWWCQDFVLEAELNDGDVSAVKLGSEFPFNGTTPGDLREATTFVSYDSVSSPSAPLPFRFTPRTPEQDTLYCWVRYRTTGGTAGLKLSLDGNQVAHFTNLNSSNWAWTNGSPQTPPMVLQGLSLEKHLLEVLPDSSNLQIDKIFLLRSGSVFDTVTASVQASADTVCLGEFTQFSQSSQLAPLCTDYTWDMGDGNVSNEANPKHRYAEVGVYEVVLTVEQPSTNFSETDTILVEVIGPEVEAGVDSLICLGDTVQLQGAASYLYKWKSDTTLSATSQLDPIATPTSDTWFFLTATDPVSGCSNTDSVEIQVSTLDPQIERYEVCDSGSIQITVGNVGSLSWGADSTLDDSDPFAAVASPIDTTHYQAIVQDLSGCFLDTVSVTVNLIPQGTPTGVSLDDTICHGESIQLEANGRTSYEWRSLIGKNKDTPSPLWLSNLTGAVTTATPPQFTLLDTTSVSTRPFIVYGPSCGVSTPDTVIVTVIQRPMINEDLIADTIVYCGDTLDLNIQPISGNRAPLPQYYDWQPAGVFGSPTTNAGRLSVSEPTTISLDIGFHLGCPGNYDMFVVPYSIDGDTILHCAGDSLELFAYTGDSINWGPDNIFRYDRKANPKAWVDQSMWVYAEIFQLDNDRDTIWTELDSVWIEVQPSVRINTPDTSLCLNDTLQLQATGANEFIWFPGGSLSDSLISTPILTVGMDSIIYVSSCDSNACPGFDSIRVTATCCQANLDTLVTKVTSSSLQAGASSINFSGERIQITDTLRVDQNELFSNSEFYFGEGGVLFVAAGISLEIINCELSTVCKSGMWTGIVLEDSSSVLGLTNSRIADAEIGVQANAGGMISVNNSNFYNNRIGLKVAQVDSTYTGSVASSQFICERSKMLPPYQSECTVTGIMVQDVEKWVIGDTSDSKSNSFKGLSSGIFALNSAITSFNNDFEDIRSCPSIPKPWFYGDGVAIYARGFSPDSLSQKHFIKVGGNNFVDNSFRDCDNGLLVEMGCHTDVKFNDFQNISEHAVRFADCGWASHLVEFNQFNNTERGVRGTLNPNSDVDIKHNNFVDDLFHAGVAIWVQDMASTGIQVHDSTLIRYNNISTYGIGIISDGIGNHGIELNNIEIVDKDPEYDYSVGITVGGSMGTSVTENVVSMPVTHSKNYDDFTIGIWMRLSGNSVVHCNETRNWFEHQRYNGPIISSSILNNEFWDDHPDTHVPQLGIHLVDSANIGQQGNSNLGTGNIWQRAPGDYWLCDGNDRAMVFAQNTPLSGISEEFYVRNDSLQNPNHPDCPFCNAGSQGPNIPIDTSAGLSELCQPVSEFNDNHTQSLLRVAQNFLLGTGEGAFGQYGPEQQFLAELKQTQENYSEQDITEAFEGLESTNHDRIYSRDQKLFLGITDLPSFSPVFDWEINHNSVQSCWKKYIAEGYLSPLDSTHLVNLGYQCSFESGFSVFQARTLSGFISPDMPPIFSDCGTAETSSKNRLNPEARSVSPATSLFPNPTDQKFSIVSSEKIIGVQAYDAHGQLTISREFAGGLRVVDIPTDAWASGVHFIRITLSGGPTKTMKVLIQR